MRGLAAALVFALGLAPGVAFAGLENILPAREGRAIALCEVDGLFVYDSMLIIRCAKPTEAGVTLFAVEREAKRYEDIKDFATWAQEKGRPLSILYSDLPRSQTSDCERSNCRAILGVERR